MVQEMFPFAASSHTYTDSITATHLIELYIWSVVSSHLIIINLIWGSVTYNTRSNNLLKWAEHKEYSWWHYGTLPPVRMAVIQKSTSNQCWRGCGEREPTLLHCWWERKLVQPLWRTVWRFLKKLEIELPYNLAIPLLGIHTKETRRERDTCTPMFIAPQPRELGYWTGTGMDKLVVIRCHLFKG